jgi:hypothetical protein
MLSRESYAAVATAFDAATAEWDCARRADTTRSKADQSRHCGGEFSSPSAVGTSNKARNPKSPPEKEKKLLFGAKKSLLQCIK